MPNKNDKPGEKSKPAASALSTTRRGFLLNVAGALASRTLPSRALMAALPKDMLAGGATRAQALTKLQQDLWGFMLSSADQTNMESNLSMQAQFLFSQSHRESWSRMSAAELKAIEMQLKSQMRRVAQDTQKFYTQTEQLENALLSYRNQIGRHQPFFFNVAESLPQFSMANPAFRTAVEEEWVRSGEGKAFGFDLQKLLAAKDPHAIEHLAAMKRYFLKQLKTGFDIITHPQGAFAPPGSVFVNEYENYYLKAVDKYLGIRFTPAELTELGLDPKFYSYSLRAPDGAPNGTFEKMIEDRAQQERLPKESDHQATSPSLQAPRYFPLYGRGPLISLPPNNPTGTTLPNDRELEDLAHRLRNQNTPPPHGTSPYPTTAAPHPIITPPTLLPTAHPLPPAPVRTTPPTPPPLPAR